MKRATRNVSGRQRPRAAGAWEHGSMVPGERPKMRTLPHGCRFPFVRRPSKAVDGGVKPRWTCLRQLEWNVISSNRIQIGVSHGNRRPWKAVLLGYYLLGYFATLVATIRPRNSARRPATRRAHEPDAGAAGVSPPTETRCENVRRNIRPPETAGVEWLGSPSGFLASTRNSFSSAAMTHTMPSSSIA